MKPTALIIDDREGLLGQSPGAARLRELAELRVVHGSLDNLSDDYLRTVQVLMAVRERTTLDAGSLERLPALEVLLQSGGHAYHVDPVHLAERGIPVALMRRAVGPKAAVPELTFALAVAALRMIPEAHASMVAGQWRPFTGRTLKGRTMGILGYGRHGANVARIARAYGMDVVVWRRTPDKTVLEDANLADLDTVLKVSDVLSVHLKLSDESRGLLNARRLQQMKPGSILVNTSRGAVVDEAALIDALVSGPLSAAGLDVFSQEPLPHDSPLRSLPNTVLTPHIGWTVEEVLTEFAEIAAAHLEAFLTTGLDRNELLDPAVALRKSSIGSLR
ncbi:NAD(P)-dependent oxidoreductase [Arthrobacter sp. KK5.5]|uniref:NAD(P)-dependent oxidoreductase n=1 Tax=Arthrobacter sp. KK5.5 TaxID=3373084 RepID=UPI003EE5C781